MIVIKGKKILKGTAAQISYISDNGGWDKYHEDLVNKITEEVSKEVATKILKELIYEQNKHKFKIIK
ncbi:hypothetical protein [Intestinibacter bartlettii]|uniref:hypothetical protein n=1 Tax=Intestinibacter bartlettii TaxID=261299 RepID=UPI0011074B28|nr:hypothetical protein [Intestinibacter bartlettii]